MRSQILFTKYHSRKKRRLLETHKSLVIQLKTIIMEICSLVLFQKGMCLFFMFVILCSLCFYFYVCYFTFVFFFNELFYRFRREQKFYDDYGFLVGEPFVEEYKKFYELKQKNRNVKIDLKWKDVILPPHNWYE